MITTNGDYDLEEVKEQITAVYGKGRCVKDLCEEALCASRRPERRLRCWTAVQRTILPGI